MKKTAHSIVLLIFLVVLPLDISDFSNSMIINNNNQAMGMKDEPISSDQEVFTVDEQWVLNQTSQQQIVWNNQTLESYAQEIIDSFDSGSWKTHSYTPTIRSTFHAIQSLKMLDKLSSVDITEVTNFILNRFNPSTYLFYDEMCGLLPFSTPAQKIGYSEIEATAYSILILDTLDSLNLLSSEQLAGITYALRLSLNANDGGFSHSSTGDPSTVYEGSSLLLSYYCYSALEILQPSYPISTEQKDALVSFVSSRQNMNMGDLSVYGGYMEDEVSAVTTIESTYYAIKLLDALNHLEEISSTALIHHLEALEHPSTGGVFNTFHPSKTHMPQPEFFSSSLVLEILEITGVGASINITKCKTYIEEGYDTETKSWHLYNTSSFQYLKDQMLILTGLQSIGQVNTSIGNEEFINDHCIIAFANDTYESGYTSIRKSLGSITGLFHKLSFLKEIGRITDLHRAHKNAIMTYLNSLIVTNTFAEIPGFNPNIVETVRYFGYGLELSVLPYYVSENRVFGMGIHQISMALQISELIGNLDLLNQSFSFHNIAIEIINCQENEGFFRPYTNSLSGTFESTLLTFDAIRSLSIIDSYLGTNYLGSVDETALITWVLSLSVFEDSSLYFEDGNTDPLHTLMVTKQVWDIDFIMNLGIFGPVNLSKVRIWIENHPDMPLQENSFTTDFSFFAILLYYSISDSVVQVYLPRMVGAIRNFLGGDSSIHSELFISYKNYEILKYCLRDWYSITAFASIPDIQVGYKMRFDVMSSGFSYICYEEHNLIIILPNMLNSSSSVIGTSHIIQFQQDCLLHWYPNFTIEIQDDFMDGRVRITNFTISTHLLYVVDVTDIPTTPSLFPGDTMSFSISLFLNPRTGTGSKPLNCSSTFTIQNETTEILSDIGTIIDGKYVIMVTVNITVLDPDLYIIETTLFHDIFQYEPGYIGNTNNLTRSDSTIRILNSFIISGEKPKIWRLAALGGVVSVSGIAFGVTGYFVYRKVRHNTPKNKYKRREKKTREVPFKESFKLIWIQFRDKTKQFVTTTMKKIKESTQTLVNRIQSVSSKQKSKNKFVAEKTNNPFFLDEKIVNPSFLEEKPNLVKNLFDTQKKKEGTI